MFNCGRMLGGRRICKSNIQLNINLIYTNMALRSIMAYFGASVQDPDGRLILKSKQTLESMKFVKALYQETMTDEVFTWDASSNFTAEKFGPKVKEKAKGQHSFFASQPKSIDS